MTTIQMRLADGSAEQDVLTDPPDSMTLTKPSSNDEISDAVKYVIAKVSSGPLVDIDTTGDVPEDAILRLPDVRDALEDGLRELRALKNQPRD